MRQAIYVELDCLLDTRLGAIAQVSQDAAAAVVAHPEYRKRLVDDWHKLSGGLIDTPTFIEAYRKRNVDTLKLSRSTAMVEMVLQLIQRQEELAVMAPTANEIVLVVNTWPYKLSDTERNTLGMLLFSIIGLNTKIEFTSMPVAAMNPITIRAMYDCVIMYDFNGWMTIHSESLLHNKMPQISMVVPALHQSLPNEDFTTYPDLHQLGCFGVTEAYLVEHVELVMAEPRYYSLVDLAHK